MKARSSDVSERISQKDWYLGIVRGLWGCVKLKKLSFKICDLSELLLDALILCCDLDSTF